MNDIDLRTLIKLRGDMAKMEARIAALEEKEKEKDGEKPKLRPTILDAVRKGLGAYPFNDSSNPCSGDGLYWKSLKEKWSPEELEAAEEIVTKEQSMINEFSRNMLLTSHDKDGFSTIDYDRVSPIRLG